MHKLVNGKSVPLTPEEISERIQEESEFKAKQELYFQSEDHVRKQRAQAYPPIGDQLDAIISQLNYMQLDGQTDLIKPMDEIVAAWLKVKRDYPKPKDKE